MRRLALLMAATTMGTPLRTADASMAPMPPATQPATTTPPKPPKLTEFVMKANPKLTRDGAMHIAGIIEKTAVENEIDIDLFAAVLKQESHFKPGTKSCYFIGQRRTCDYGIAQINTFWAEELELDIKRLKEDDEYNIRTAALILKGFLVRHDGDKYAYSYYNTGDPKLRLVYQGYVEKYRKQAKQALLAQN